MRLTTTDAAFLYIESARGPMHISSISIIEGELEYDAVFAHFESRMHLLPAYRRKLAQVPLNLAHPTWVDDLDFDLGHHVRHHQVAPGTTLEQAVDIANELNEPILDRARPLWDTVVITGVAGHTLLLHRTHHAMIDGASGVELLAIVYDFDPQGDPVPPAREWVPETPPGPVEQFSTALRENLDKLARTDWSALVGGAGDRRSLLLRAARVMADFVTRPVITAPFNSGLVGPKRSLAWISKSFDEVREVRRAMGGTINDVVLTMVSAAVADYLEQHGADTQDAHMRIMCPVNVRTEGQKGALGNQVSAIFPVLPAWPMEATQRLAAVCAETGRIKQNQDAQALTVMQQTLPEPWPIALWPTQIVGTRYDPAALAANVPLPRLPAGVHPPNVGYNFTCTNVPGPQVPQYLCGCRVRDQIGLLVLTGNIGFSVTILSYNKQLNFGFICEPRLMPDVQIVADAASATFDELLEAARARAAQFTN